MRIGASLEGKVALIFDNMIVAGWQIKRDLQWRGILEIKP
jgi:hypothetical protein